MTELLVVASRGHHLHHVKDKAYLESPRRLDAIQRGLCFEGTRTIEAGDFPLRHITDVHASGLVSFIKSASEQLPPGQYEYPFLFPPRNTDRPPKQWDLAIGYYCIDTFTPLHNGVFAAARDSVNAVLTGARALSLGAKRVYGMVRPPGHHAESKLFGGFCYFNSAAIAANYLSRFGRVAMLDIDYHHGNGQQEIFFDRSDVLTVSIHGDPGFAYPYFSGFSDEQGTATGEGFNQNFPLPQRQSGHQYQKVLGKAIGVVESFNPDFLVVPLGFDGAKDDPTGSWALEPGDFGRIGHMIGEMGTPTLFVQEGGYRIGTLSAVVRAFFKGVMSA